MAKNLMTILFGLFLLVSFAGCGNNNGGTTATVSSQGVVTVNIPSGALGKGTAAYGPNPLHVPQGSKVVWQNSDTMAHTATSATGVWDTGAIQPGATSNPVTFNNIGAFPYFCTIHGATSMSGMIVVP